MGQEEGNTAMSKLPYMSLDWDIDEATQVQIDDWFQFEEENQSQINAVANALPFFLEYKVTLSEGVEAKRGGTNFTYARIVRDIKEGSDKDIADLFKEIVQCAAA